jgi:hypothetical protein
MMNDAPELHLRIDSTLLLPQRMSRPVKAQAQPPELVR